MPRTFSAPACVLEKGGGPVPTGKERDDLLLLRELLSAVREYGIELPEEEEGVGEAGAASGEEGGRESGC